MAGYLIILLFVLGVWGMIRKDNLIKKIIALNIVNSSVIILFVYLGSLSGSEAPILFKQIKSIVDPLPQALMLTAIVIGICITALALTMVLKLHRHFGTVQISQMEKKQKADDE